MKLCKLGAYSECGKKICCIECEDKDTCKYVCSYFLEDCPDGYDESSAMQVFNDKAIVLMKNIAQLDKQKKILENQDKEVREALKKTMDEFGIKSFENDILKVTFVAETTRSSIDSKKLQKELPEIAEKYSKTTKVSASVRITVK